MAMAKSRSRRVSEDPEHWRARAAEARSLAEGMPGPEAKKAMLVIAENYDRLAARALQRISQQAREAQASRRVADLSSSTERSP